ncbi:H+/nucleoside cotransporter-like protein [Morchella snyderi]|nr:H+/nucleoside cotransporter-like protein [Morchella snyderi]
MSHPDPALSISDPHPPPTTTTAAAAPAAANGPADIESGHATKGAPISGDIEKGSRSGSGASVRSAGAGSGSGTGFYRKYRVFIHAFIFCLFTGWWIASLVLHRADKNWVVPFLFWLCIALRIITLYLPVSLVFKPVQSLWKHTAVRAAALVPSKLRTPLSAVLVVAVYLIGAFASPESLNNTRDNRAVSLFGLLVFVGVLWATSKHRAHVKWHTVLVGMLMQFIIALFVLRTGVGYDIFHFISGLAEDLLSFAKDGVAFLTSAEISQLGMFFISVLPAIIFFVALVQLLYYWGILQWFIGKFAVFFFWSMQVSGAEAVVAAASPFIGQGESAMLIRPFVPYLTLAEIHQVMTSGFATIAGSVLVAYIGMGINPQALISACVMSIPASLAVSKLRYPETEESLTAGRVVVPHDEGEERPANALHAFANGAWLGLKIAGMILSTLLCILALLGLCNGLLTWWGRYLNINDPPLTVELIVGYVCYPVAFLLGVSRDGDLYKVAQLIGTKLIANEFVAYTRLQQEPEFETLSDRSRLIATYALCGFANIGSLGTQIGVLSQVAPSRAGDVSRLALSALVAGAISTLTSASVAGLVVTDQRQFTTPTL